MHPYIVSFKEGSEQAIGALIKEYASVRAGQASPSLVEDLMVMAYGVNAPLKQLAAITIPEARMIVVQPWDKSILKDIERALQESTLQLSAVVEGSLVRLTVPQMTEERRKETLKEIGRLAEETRVRIRKVRDTVREKIVAAERAKGLTEDDRYALFKEIDDRTKEFTARVEETAKKKEQEVMTV